MQLSPHALPFLQTLQHFAPIAAFATDTHGATVAGLTKSSAALTKAMAIFMATHPHSVLEG